MVGTVSLPVLCEKTEHISDPLIIEAEGAKEDKSGTYSVQRKEIYIYIKNPLVKLCIRTINSKWKDFNKTFGDDNSIQKVDLAVT